MAGHFRFSIWDPILIITQIITIQSIFYTSLGFWLVISDALSGATKSLDQLFLYDIINMKNIQGRFIIGSFFLNSLVCALALWCFVQRTRLCLDFSVTVHLLHLLACWGYNHTFPSTLSWWIVHVLCVTIMCVCGEFLCMRTEMKAIPLSLGPKADL